MQWFRRHEELPRPRYVEETVFYYDPLAAQRLSAVRDWLNGKNITPLDGFADPYWMDNSYIHHSAQDYVGASGLEGKTYNPGEHPLIGVSDHLRRVQNGSERNTTHSDSYFGDINSHFAGKEFFFDGVVDPLAAAYAQADRAMNEGIRDFEAAVNMPFKALSGLYGIPSHARIIYRGSRVGYDDNG